MGGICVGILAPSGMLMSQGYREDASIVPQIVVGEGRSHSLSCVSIEAR